MKPVTTNEAILSVARTVAYNGVRFDLAIRNLSLFLTAIAARTGMTPEDAIGAIHAALANAEREAEKEIELME